MTVTFTTYIAALKIEQYKAYGSKKYIIHCGLLLGFIPLLLFKYYNFLNDSLSSLLSELGSTNPLPGLNWVLPLGISFYTLQAVGYLIDVYLQRIKAEHNWWDYMLFVCFFPQIASGPISKAADLLPQIKGSRIFKYEQAVQGMKWLLWGMFIKVVIADRLALIVNDTFIHVLTSSGLSLFMASIFYSVQIYCDFAGYSFMALGVGQLLGFELVNNFQRPYFSQSITEFWHRWHISLSTWLKDYIYIPLGGSRCTKRRNYYNILITFVVSGIWHGANWTFLFWGFIHGLIQIVEKAFGLNIKKTGIIKSIKIIITFFVVTFAWIFFRASSVSEAFYIISKIFNDFSGSMSSWVSCFVLSIVVFLKDYIDEHRIESLMLLNSKYLVVRWSTYIILAILIMTFGVYGGQFIYSGF